MPKLTHEMTHADLMRELRRAEADLAGARTEYDRLLGKQARLIVRVVDAAAALKYATDDYLAVRRNAQIGGAVGPTGLEVDDAGKAAAGS